MAGKKAVTSYLVYEQHNCDNSQNNCRSVVSILESVRSEKKQNCSIWDNSYKNCRSVGSILVALTFENSRTLQSVTTVRRPAAQ